METVIFIVQVDYNCSVGLFSSSFSIFVYVPRSWRSPSRSPLCMLMCVLRHWCPFVCWLIQCCWRPNLLWWAVLLVGIPIFGRSHPCMSTFYSHIWSIAYYMFLSPLTWGMKLGMFCITTISGVSSFSSYSAVFFSFHFLFDFYSIVSVFLEYFFDALEFILRYCGSQSAFALSAVHRNR